MRRTVNTFVYDLVAEWEMKQPDIPVISAEHYGQCAEDLIVAALLLAMTLRDGSNLAGERYLEIGANHPVSCSATYLLHRRYGMRGVLVEANPRLLADLRRFRPEDEVVHAAVVPDAAETVEFHVANQDELSSVDRRFVEEWRGGEIGISQTLVVPATTIGGLFARHFPDRAPLFLAIDVEGLDLTILQTLDWSRWRPAVVQAEPSEHHSPGNTAATIRFLESVGYAVLSRTDVNLIAIDTGRIPLVGAPGESGAPPHPTIFQALDEVRRVAADREAAILRLEEDMLHLERKAEAEIAALQAQLEKVRVDRESLAAEISAQQVQLAQARRDRESLEADMAFQKSRLDQAEGDLSAQRSLLDHARSIRERLDAEIVDLRTRKANLHSSIDALRGKLDAAVTAARQLKSDQKSAKAALATSRRQVAKLEAELKAIRQKLSAQQAAMKAMKSSWAWRATTPFRYIGRFRRKRQPA
jgi:FkbM family methyltransferase